MSVSTSKHNSAVQPAELAEDVVGTVRAWLKESQRIAAQPGGTDVSAQRLAGVLKDPDGLPFTIGFVDRVVRPVDLRVAARNLQQVALRTPGFLPRYLRFMIRLAGAFARLLPWLVVPIARRVFRGMVGHLMLDASPKRLGKTLAQLRAKGARVNINLLGEAVLGIAEADRRLAKTRELLTRDDIDYMSIKVSAVSGKLSIWGYDETVERVVARLTPLYGQAAASPTPKFINLDMEEFHDLDLTIDVFKRLLDQPALKHLEAGIVLQCYLPDALSALQRLTQWALERRAAGGAGIKVRMVKGANLAMERVDSIQRGWPLATVGSKQEADTNYKRVLNWAMTPERAAAVRLGIAGHNLFDIAFAWELANRRGVSDRIEFEMLLGMATAQAQTVAKHVGAVRYYTPVVRPSDFTAAIAYLIRRLEENASSDNFMSAVFDLADDERLFEREERRFRAALAEVDETVPMSNRIQDRTAGGAPVLVRGHEPDTDPSIAVNRAWGLAILERSHESFLGTETVASAALTNEAQVAAQLTTAAESAAVWARRGGTARQRSLLAAADVLSAHRGRFIEVLVGEAGKTIAEADSEASATADVARHCAGAVLGLEAVDGAKPLPVRVSLVVAGTDDPVSSTASNALGALAAGSAVVLKPTAGSERSVAVLAEALWDAGLPRELVSMAVPADEGLERQLASHPAVDRVLMNSDRDTALRYRSWRGARSLIGQTAGVNTAIIMPSADIDLAVGEVVTAAFANAGQRRDRLQVAILVGSVVKSEQFRRQLVDAVTSMGPAWTDLPTSSMGPLHSEPDAALLTELTSLSSGESWLVKPGPLSLESDGRSRLWSPGVKDGVRQGSPLHLRPVLGPLLALMHADTLADAVALANATGTRLSAAIHSLDQREIDEWLETIEAGNLFVNRAMTGVVVGRQPYGGWEGSAIGAHAKVGGPHHLLALVDWESAGTNESPSFPETDIDPSVRDLIEAARAEAEVADFDRLRAAVNSDHVAWNTHYSRSKELAELQVERNVMRYRATAVTIRIAEGESVANLVRTLAAAFRAGGAVAVSSAMPLPADIAALCDVSPKVQGVTVESDAQWRTRIESGELRTNRVRLIGGEAAHAALVAAVGERLDVTVWASKVTGSGLLELFPFLREQSVSVTAHRFGNPDQDIEKIAL